MHLATPRTWTRSIFLLVGGNPWVGAKIGCNIVPKRDPKLPAEDSVVFRQRSVTKVLNRLRESTWHRLFEARVVLARGLLRVGYDSPLSRSTPCGATTRKGIEALCRTQ
jgi:chorismate-pyruvate lyase